MFRIAILIPILKSGFFQKTSDNVNCNILSDNEKAILDKVIKKFKNYTSKEIVEYMHQETAYTKTVSGEVIPYSFSKELKRF